MRRGFGGRWRGDARVTSRIWDYFRSVRWRLHEAIRGGVGARGSVSFIYHGGTGYNHIMRCDLYGGLMILLLRCCGEMRGMKSLYTDAGFIVAGYSDL
jgi:hypothetical protein